MRVAGQRAVLVDPDGTAPDWTYVVIEHKTGVIYQHEFGGTATRLGEVEGYLVPVNGENARSEFDAVFVQRLRGVGSWGKVLEPDLLEAVRNAVSTIRYWFDAQGSSEVEFLTLDENRLDEVDEAWLPVVTSDGRGVLIWPNSD